MGTSSGGTNGQTGLLLVIYEPDLDKWLKMKQSLEANAAHPCYQATARWWPPRLLLQGDPCDPGDFLGVFS